MTDDRTKDIEVIRVTAEIQPSVNVDSELLLALIRERDEARERIAEQEREYQRERIVQVREINARLAAEAALSAAQEEVARYKRKLMQGEAILAGWTRIDRIKLAAGEMTAQEARTGLAVAKGIAASVRSAIAAEPAALTKETPHAG